jgi:peroxiredoxin
MNFKWLAGVSLGIMLGIFTFFANTAKPVPNITFHDLRGKEISLQSYKGRPVLVHFWATSCPGCIREMPTWIDLYKNYHKQGLEVIAVAMSYDQPEFVKTYTETNNLPFPISIDSTGEAAKAFGDVKLTPTTIWIDREGKWTHTTLGEIQKEQLMNWLKKETQQTSS